MNNFISEIIQDDIDSGKHQNILTRFPPEPNGYLHIGHATAICLNFGIAEEIDNAICNLRFDDTNPSKENSEFIESIKKDIKWLGFDWGDREFYASTYFPKLYEFAIQLIREGKAYVDSQPPDEVRNNRGTLTQPGIDSPFRNRSVEESINLFQRMRSGEFNEGEHVLRAKIDMSSPNINMRDPVMYRIIHAQHHQTGNEWPIYPMYDYAHGISDSIEGITHSLCTKEYEDHRPLYDWFIQQLNIFPSRQIEFAKVSLSHTILSKRNLLKLVESGQVSGWDDPRMPTLSGMRRLGYTPKSIRTFADKVGITKRENVSDISLLESCLRDDLDQRANRVMAVLNPLKVTISNYPEGKEEYLEAKNHPKNDSAGTRNLPFSKVLYIDRDDFMENAPRKFYRLTEGREVRLRYAYFIKCEKVVKNPVSGEIEELVCTYDPETKGGNAPDGRKVRATIHWVSAVHALSAKIMLYDRLCVDENPDMPDGDCLDQILNPNSLETISAAKIESSLGNSQPLDVFQFERVGYFCVDSAKTPEGNLIFNRSVALRDTWAKVSNNPRN